MDRRQLIGGGAAALGLVSVGYAFFAPVSDEELITQVLDDLAVALSFSEPIGNVIFRGSHLSEQFEDIFTDQVRIRVSGVRGSIPATRGKLGVAAARALSSYGSLDVSFSTGDMVISEASAEVKATATVTGTFRGEMKRDERPVSFTFAKVDGDWRIQAAHARAPQ